MSVLLDVQQGHARLFSGEPVCRLLGEQALGDRLQRPSMQQRRRFACDDPNDRVEQ
jgi:hypothetical protein